MKISMHIICDRMKRHKLHTEINSGQMSFDRVQFLAVGEEAADSDTLYLVDTRQMTDDGIKKGVLCLNGNDRVFIETDTPTLIFSEILDIFYFYDYIEKTALEQIGCACSLQELLETLSKGLTHNIFIINAGCKLISHVRNYPAAPITEQHYEEIFESGHLPLPTIYRLLDIGLLDIRMDKAQRHSTDFFPTSHILRDIYRFNEHVGRISVPEDIGLCSIGECQLVDAIADLLQIWYEKTNYDNSNFSPATFYKSLLSDESSPYGKEDYHFYSTLLKWSESNEKYVVCIDISGKKEAEIKFALFHLREVLSKLHPFVSEKFICLVINADAAETKQIKAKISRELEYISMSAGVSYPFQDITNLNTAYEEAKIGAVYGVKTAGTITKCSNCKLEYIHSTLRKNLKIELSTGKLHQLKEYDIQHNTDYYKTLYIYLLNERNQNLTADILTIHRNTLTRRIEKIYSIIDSELDSPIERLSLLFSFFSEEANPLNHMN